MPTARGVRRLCPLSLLAGGVATLAEQLARATLGSVVRPGKGVRGTAALTPAWCALMRLDQVATWKSVAQTLMVTACAARAVRFSTTPTPCINRVSPPCWFARSQRNPARHRIAHASSIDTNPHDARCIAPSHKQPTRIGPLPSLQCPLASSPCAALWRSTGVGSTQDWILRARRVVFSVASASLPRYKPSPE